MSIAFLNDNFLPLEQAKISPLDRGFLFGDGIYEVVPSYHGKLLGFNAHLDRMRTGLEGINLQLGWSHEKWKSVCDELCNQNGNGNLGLYLQVSRGADIKRYHAFPENVKPTVFGFAFEIGASPSSDKGSAKTFSVSTAEDLRWQRCHIKSTALLGNVLHFQYGHENGDDETILYNDRHELTEAAACNVFIVKNRVISTPPLDNQLLPGITRNLLIDILKKHSNLNIQERVVHMNEVNNADEIWITSSTKEIGPVIKIDGRPVGNGMIGDIWVEAQKLFTKHKYDY
jgi:D-alanine transaminase